MARDERGKRDGSGPYRDSDRAKGGQGGRRSERGEGCPKGSRPEKP